jgi:single-stranded-DNA-specific exonuclease
LPNFLFEKVAVSNSRTIGANNQHLKFTLTDTINQLDGVGFGFGAQALEFRSDDLNVVGQLSINEWNGKRIPQLMLEDYQINALQVFDYRAKKYQQALQFTEPTLFISFSEKTAKKWEKKLQQSVTVITDDTPIQSEVEQVVFLDCPTEVSRVYILCQAEDEAYLDGLGSRDQYARLFKFIAAQDKVDVRYKLSIVADYLKIPQKLLVFMIQVFSELGFVAITDGVMRKVDHPVNHALTESRIYQERAKQIKIEEFLLLSDLTTLKDWLSI